MSHPRLSDPGLFVMRLLLILLIVLQLGSLLIPAHDNAEHFIIIAGLLVALAITHIAYRLSSVIPTSTMSNKVNPSSMIGVLALLLSMIFYGKAVYGTISEDIIANALLTSALVLVGVILIAGNIILYQLLEYFKDNEKRVDLLIAEN